MTAAEWIAARRELLAAATEGPWEATFGPRELARVWTAHPDDREALATITGFVEDRDGGADAALIADARTSLPAALDALEAASDTVHLLPHGRDDDDEWWEGYASALDDIRRAIEAKLGLAS